MAKLAEQAERYDDMVEYMHQIVKLGIKANELTVEERNLLSVGYKNMMSNRRTAWRTVMQSPNAHLQSTKDYIGTITAEVEALIETVCNKIVKEYVEGQNAAPPAGEAQGEDNRTEVLVFFKKMEGDYNRYGAEISEGDDKTRYKEASSKAYEQASEFAKNLPSTNPIRLGLALNFSVFFYEICDMKEKASGVAKEAFDTAIDHLDTLGDDEYKDSTLIMQLLKDNLTLWSNDQQEDGADEGDLQVEEMN
jgi:14-3-3 protein epsilon